MATQRPVALVTGAARRVGAAIAQALAVRGYAVAVHYRSSRDEAVSLASALGNEARTFEGALEDADVPSRLVREVVSHYGRLDLLVNSAASFHRTPLDTLTPERWDEIFAVNLRAPFFLALEASRVMADGGQVINLSDLAGFETWSAYIPHGLAKGALASATRSLAKVLAPRVRVNAIAPGVVLVPDDLSPEASAQLERTTPLQRHGSPEDVVRAVEYLLDATFVTGQVLFVDGGRHVRH